MAALHHAATPSWETLGCMASELDKKHIIFWPLELKAARQLLISCVG
jgi:hypothetical protein